MIKNKNFIILVDYQYTGNYILSEEEKKLQRLKKSIIYVQNKRNNRDVSRKTRKNYSNIILALGRYLKNNGHQVLYVSLPSDQTIYEENLKFADFIYFWSSTPNFEAVKEYIVEAKAKHPNITTILAGYHANGLPRQTLSQVREIDYISLGESEYALNLIINKKKNEEIPGIAFRKDNEIIINPKPNLLRGEELPSPDYSLLHGDKKKYRYYLQMTRSCSYRCKYCVYGYFGGPVRSRTIDSIKQELTELRSIMGNKFEMHILDNVISYDITLLKELCNLIAELDMDLSFSADIRPECVNKEVLDVLKELNVKQLFIGFEDANDSCREFVGRKMKNDVLINALKLIKRYPTIRADCYWMLGLPGTSKETFNENIAFVRNLIMNNLLENICPDTIFVPLPGTPLFNEAEEYNITNLDKNWSSYRRSNYWPVYDLPTISRKEMHSGLIEFDKAIISAQLSVLGMTEREVIEEYFNSDNGNNVEDFLK